MAPADQSNPDTGAPDADEDRPAVLIAVVAADPGDWFEQTLASIAAQDHERVRVVVIDAGAGDPEDFERWVHTTLPSAAVVDADPGRGFAAAANRLLEGELKAPFLLLCHDDVALAPDALGQMVGEALRSDAAVVGPKLVHWDRPDVLQHVGLGADKFGVTAALAEEDELDQEQHDAVADVFVVPSAAMLIRSELFARLEGFDPVIEFRGEDLDLCWRAQLAGERVLVAPDAVVRHREALNDRRGRDDTRRLRARHQLRAVLSNYGWLHLVRVLPQMLLMTLAEVGVAVVAGRFAQARDLLAAWPWNLKRLGSIHRRRRLVSRTRAIPDRELRRFQERGSARFTAFVRGQIGRHEEQLGLAGAGRGLATSLKSGPVRNALVVWGTAAIVLIFGSRALLGESLPAVGGLYRFPDGPSGLLRSWWSGWSEIGVGSEGASPIGLGLLGFAGFLFLGAMSVLRTVLVLGMIPLGAVGAWRLLRPTGSRRARTVALVLYLAAPVPYNALAAASWSGLIAYAAMPWLAGLLLRALGAAPYGDREGGFGPGVRRQSMLRQILGLGALIALVGAYLPFVVALVGVAVVGIVVGSVVAARAGGVPRLLAVSLGAAVVAFALHLPWSLELVTGSPQWAPFGGAGSDEAATLGYAEIVRFDTGPVGSAPLGWAFLAPAALVLVVGRGWRLAWGVRAWFIALGAWGVVWAGEAGALPVGLPRPEIVLSVAATGVALAAGMSMVAFEVDVRRHRFGWRQLVPLAAGVGLVLTALPVVGAAFDGDWKVPDRDFDETLGFLAEPADTGSYRVLWIGHPDTLPLPGWPIGVDVAFATSVDGLPDVSSAWLPPADASTRRLSRALDAAFRGDTSRLGASLGELGIRYVILPQQVAPEPFASVRLPSPDRLLDALSAQLDLERRAGVNGGVVVYENDVWTPVRSVLSEGAVEAAAQLPLERLSASSALLDRRSSVEYRGPVRTGDHVRVAVAPSTEWRLDVDGESADSSAFGDGSVLFDASAGGNATLTYETPITRRLAAAAQLVVWVVVGAVIVRLRRRVAR